MSAVPLAVATSLDRLTTGQYSPGMADSRGDVGGGRGGVARWMRQRQFLLHGQFIETSTMKRLPLVSV